MPDIIVQILLFKMLKCLSCRQDNCLFISLHRYGRNSCSLCRVIFRFHLAEKKLKKRVHSPLPFLEDGNMNQLLALVYSCDYI